MYEEIYEQNKGLLFTMARSYARACELDRAVDLEDLTQTAFVGLARAAESFDAGAGKSWASWACWHIRRELNAALGLRNGRFTRAHTGADTLDRTIPSRADGETTPLELLADDSLPDADEALFREELRRGVREAVARLRSEELRQVVSRCRLEGQSIRQAAHGLGISVGRARRLCDEGSAHLARDRRLAALWNARGDGRRGPSGRG